MSESEINNSQPTSFNLDSLAICVNEAREFFSVSSFSDADHQELLSGVFISLFICIVDRGWSMNFSSVLSIVLFTLVFTGVARSSDPQLQQICTNAGMCLLAVRSGLSGRGLISNHINYVIAAVRYRIPANRSWYVFGSGSTSQGLVDLRLRAEPWSATPI
jgi:hypothetical protein